MIAECQCFSEAKAGDICGACMCAEEEHLWCTQLRLLCLWHTAPLVLWLFLPSPCLALSVSRWYLWWAGPRALIQVSSFYLCACTSSYVTECLGIISDCVYSYRYFFFPLFFFFSSLLQVGTWAFLCKQERVCDGAWMPLGMYGLSEVIHWIRFV